jgi:hypothetical protein
METSEWPYKLPKLDLTKPGDEEDVGTPKD